MKRNTMSLKSALFLHEQNLDRKQRPIDRRRGETAFVIERIIDQRGKVVKKKTRPTEHA